MRLSLVAVTALVLLAAAVGGSGAVPVDISTFDVTPGGVLDFPVAADGVRCDQALQLPDTQHYDISFTNSVTGGRGIVNATDAPCLQLGPNMLANSKTWNVTVRGWHVFMNASSLNPFPLDSVFFFNGAATVTFVDCVFEGINVKSYLVLVLGTPRFRMIDCRVVDPNQLAFTGYAMIGLRDVEDTEIRGFEATTASTLAQYLVYGMFYFQNTLVPLPSVYVVGVNMTNIVGYSTSSFAYVHGRFNVTIADSHFDGLSQVRTLYVLSDYAGILKITGTYFGVNPNGHLLCYYLLKLTIQDCTFAGNGVISSTSGLAMYIYDVREMLVTDTSCSGFTAQNSGGSIYAYVSSVAGSLARLERVDFVDSVTLNGYGGGVYFYGGYGLGVVELVDVTFQGCRSTYQSASFELIGFGNVNLTDVTVGGGYAGTTGACGTITQISGDAHIEGFNCYNSTATNVGGLYVAYVGTLAMVDSEFSFVEAYQGAAAYLFTVTTVAITGLRVSHATSLESGGALWFNDAPVVSIVGAAFENAVAAVAGGAVWVDLDDGDAFVISDSNFTDCRSGDKGAALHAAEDVTGSGGTLTVVRSMFVRGNSSGSGAAINAEDGFLNVTASEFRDGFSAQSAGAIRFVSPGTLDVTDCVFEGNTAAVAGGALQVVGVSTATLKRVKLASNTALNGGALWFNDAPVVSIVDAAFENSVAVDTGGAMSVDLDSGDEVLISDSNFTDCRSGDKGGALQVIEGGGSADGTLTVVRSEFVRGNSSGSGAAINAENVFLNVTASKFRDGLSAQNAGAIRFVSPGTLDVTDCEFEGNTAAVVGGALEVVGVSTATLTRVKLASNTALNGGGLWFYQGDALGVSDCEVYDNVATEVAGDSPSVGGIYTEFGGANEQVNVIKTRFARNAGNTAGGLWFGTGSVGVIDESDFADDTPSAYACENVTAYAPATVDRSMTTTFCNTVFDCSICTPSSADNTSSCCGDECIAATDLISCPTTTTPPPTTTTEAPISCRVQLGLAADEDYYLKGDVCTRCPSGAMSCGEGIFSDWRPRPTFWQASNDTVALKCWALDETQLATKCPGLAWQRCGPNYVNTSERCTECAADTYSEDGLCLPCEGPSWWLIGLGAGLLVVGVVILVIYGRRLKEYTQSISLCLGYIQILALLYYAYLQWPRRVQRLWFAFTLANFNVEVMRAECSMEIFRNYNTKWLLQASLPILFAVICLITVLIISCHACTVARNEDRLRRCCPSAYAPRPSGSGNTSGRGARGSGGTKGGAALSFGADGWDAALEDYGDDLDFFFFGEEEGASCGTCCSRACCTPWTTADLGRLRRSILSGFLTFLSFAYISLAELSLRNFACIKETEDEVDVYYFAADRTLFCFDDWWWALFPFAVGGIVIFLIGIPATFATLIFKNREAIKGKEGKKDKKVRGIEILFYRYRPEFYYWELVVLGRKVAVVAVFLFLSGADYVVAMITCLVVVMAVALVAQLWAQPYAERRHNRIEVALMIIVLLVFLAGIVSYVSYNAITADRLEETVVETVVAQSSSGSGSGSWIGSWSGSASSSGMDDSIDSDPVRRMIVVAVFALVIPALLAICVLIIYDIRDVRKKVKAVVEVRRSKRLSHFELDTLHASIAEADVASMPPADVSHVTENPAFEGGGAAMR